MTLRQPSLGINFEPSKLKGTYKEKLVSLLTSNLDFHGQSSGYGAHKFHSFPAKFPPQLPRWFIGELTNPDEIVLDPMAGSGTTVLEAIIAHRSGIGFDIDPLAVKISSVKIMALDIDRVIATGANILERARFAAKSGERDLWSVKSCWDDKTQAFVDYWFAPATQVELFALAKEIGRISEQSLRAFFELAFSAIIVTKTGGVSLALDLAHTRPHRAKTVISKSGEVIISRDLSESSSGRNAILTKTLRSPFDEFEKRYKSNLDGLITVAPKTIVSKVMFGNAEHLPLLNNSVDLIVTSPPYAANAIDYMRAHKFSLVWLGYPIDELGGKRKDYIGSDATANFQFEDLPPLTSELLARISKVDMKKSLVIRRYFSEMARVLRELYRVLKPGKSAILVVGTSNIRGIDTETQNCLADIGQSIGFEVPKIGLRSLDRNRRMLPAGLKLNMNSQIQQRMHQEFVIGFYKSIA
jgi:DNA modification methylase